MTDLAVAPDPAPATLTAAASPVRPAAGHRSASFARVVGADCTDRAWPLDGAGVEQVAARLARLGERWGIVHGVPVQRAGVADLLLVGPSGVFAVTVRHAPGASVWAGGDTLLVNGAPQPWVGQCRQLAGATADSLTDAAGRRVEVTSLLVFVGAHEGFVCHRQPRDGVRVLTRRDVDGWLRAQPARLSPDDVDSLYAAARSPRTWAA